MIKFVGLKNCDTCRKAKKWLEAEGIEYSYHDVRVDGLNVSDVAQWAEAVGWEQLLNRRGTTWRTLSEEDKTDVDAAKAVDLIVANPALMKRPLFLTDQGVILGFKKEQQDQLSALK